MTAKEYLSQAYRLDQRINSNLAEISGAQKLDSRKTAADGGQHLVSRARREG